jgi:ABC-type multidrug transport system ATPase subunit
MPAGEVSLSTHAIETIALGKTLDDRPVIRGIDLSIAAGEYVVILGVNGAGKTTLLKMLSTLTSPTSGSIRLFGPDLILADEPFAGLDVPGADAVERLLANLHRAGKTIVMVNHDVSQSLRLSDRIIVLSDGVVREDRPSGGISPEQILKGMSSYRRAALAVA